MRRPLNWFVFALSLGFLLLGRALQAPRPAPVAVEPVRYAPPVAAAMPVALTRHADLEFGYVESDR